LSNFVVVVSTNAFTAYHEKGCLALSVEKNVITYTFVAGESTFPKTLFLDRFWLRLLELM